MAGAPEIHTKKLKSLLDYHGRSTRRECNFSPQRILFWLHVYLIYILGFVPLQAQGIRWLGIYRLPRGADHPIDSKADRFTSAECYTATVELGLRRRQSWFCNHPKFGYAMLAVLRAAHAVGYHCPRVFADRRWNCTSIHRLPEISPELRRGTREQALVHAFSSAALLFEIGRYCALNKIRYCSCDEEDATQMVSDILTEAGSDTSLIYHAGREAGNLDEIKSHVPSSAHNFAKGRSIVSRYQWSGCSDNIRVARKYVAAFLGISTTKIAKLSKMEMEQLVDIEEVKSSPDRHSLVSSRTKRDIIPPTSGDLTFSGRQFTIPPQRRMRLESHQDVDQYRTHFETPHANTMLVERSHRRQSVLDRSRNRSKNRRIIDRHNYLAGVVLMELNEKSICKCHGVSGSCAHRVCFRQLRRIDDGIMQNTLKLRYLAAKHVIVNGRRQLIAKRYSQKGFVDEVVKISELAFREHSPDYCNSEPHRGSMGTHGRKCTLTDAGTANCLNMCCGRGYRNITIQEVVQCNCRMEDEFQVHCDQCHKNSTIQRCF